MNGNPRPTQPRTGWRTFLDRLRGNPVNSGDLEVRGASTIKTDVPAPLVPYTGITTDRNILPCKTIKITKTVYVNNPDSINGVHLAINNMSHFTQERKDDLLISVGRKLHRYRSDLHKARRLSLEELMTCNRFNDPCATDYNSTAFTQKVQLNGNNFDIPYNTNITRSNFARNFVSRRASYFAARNKPF